MGQILSFLCEDAEEQHLHNNSKLATLFGLCRNSSSSSQQTNILTLSKLQAGFDLARLPPEVAFLILQNLNPTDLYLAACVWWDLASDEVLWQR